MYIICILFNMKAPLAMHEAPMATALFWRTLALTALMLGAIGIVLPGLPTVPFLILAAWSGSRGWPALEAHLLDHPKHGDTIRRWRQDRRHADDTAQHYPDFSQCCPATTAHRHSVAAAGRGHLAMEPSR
jgi:hypothetical protein